jgi:hypothetical protein
VKFSFLENSVTLNLISEDHTLLRKSLHTNALHELSWLLKYLYLRGIYAHWLLNSFLYACVFLTSYQTVFIGLDTCVCWFLVEDLTLCFCLVFVLVMVFLLYSVYPLSFYNKKGEDFLLVLDRECIFKSVKCFLSHNGQMGSLLVFYFGKFWMTKTLYVTVAF